MSIPIQLVFSDGQTNTLLLEEGASILAGARDCGLSLLVDCEQGNCGTCQAQVSRGSVDMDEFSPYVLSANRLRPIESALMHWTKGASCFMSLVSS